MDKEVSLGDDIEKLYDSMLNRGLESIRLWSLMLNYCKYISENSELEARIKHRYRLDAIRSTGFDISKNAVSMRHYFDTDNCATLRISTDKDSFGRI